VINIRTEGRNGPVVGVRICREGDDVMFITEGGMIVRSHVVDVSCMGRNTQGVRLVNLRADDRVVALEVIREEDLERFGMGEEVEVETPPEQAAPGDVRPPGGSAGAPAGNGTSEGTGDEEE
jgi:DNA gyrase subunit A